MGILLVQITIGDFLGPTPNLSRDQTEIDRGEQVGTSNGGQRPSLNSGFLSRRGWPIRSAENEATILMHDEKKPYWFPAKRYGWGWGFPSVWQGWVTFIIFIVAVLVLPFIIDPNDNLPLFFALIVGCAGALVGVCYTKGEPPKWRWGNSGDNKKNAEQDASSNGG